MNLSKLAITALVTSGLFVACSEEIRENTVDTPYTAQTGNIGNVGQTVDLGLPSGTLWANKNVGASSETDNGLLFIWGDATGKKMAADNAATYTDVVEATSFEELFNNFTTEEKNDGRFCDTTQIAQTSQPKLVGKADMTPREKKEAILEFLKAKLDEAQASATGDGFLEATLINDGTWTVIMNKEKGEYFERIPSLESLYGIHPEWGQEVTPDDSLKYYDGYQFEKGSELTVGEIVITKVDYNVSGWANGNSNWAAVKDVNGTEVYKNYLGGTIGNSIKDITDDKKKDNLTFIPAYYIYSDAEHDAATANWGAGWRMPTTAELAELLNCCEWEFVGNGYKVTGPNGNSIFLPAAGYRSGEKQYGNGNAGYYASGEIIGTYTYPSMESQSKGGKGDFGSKENMPSVLMFQHGQYNTIGVYNNMSATYGLSIRPVANLLK